MHDHRIGAEYTCDDCGGVFTEAWTDEEAEAEALENFGVPHASQQPSMARVCDDCYQEIMGAIALKSAHTER